MRRTYVFFISLQLFLLIDLQQVQAQDTILFPLKIKIGLEVSGPVIHYAEKNNNLNAEGYISADINEKISATLNSGYTTYNYSQYNYKYQTHGIFLRAGADFNLLDPKKSNGKYWIGTGLRYGISRFSSEISTFMQDNYFGSITSFIPERKDWVHFIEVSPGVRAEIFKNFSMGWTVSLRMLVYSSANKDIKPIYVPGFGNSGKSLSTGLGYFLTWNFPYKKIQVIIRKEATEETEDTGKAGAAGSSQQTSGIRQ
jgi:hypothetical protein